MGQQIKNILAFANLAAGASIAIPHGLKGPEDLKLTPDVISVLNGLQITATADDTNVTVTNLSSGPLSGAVLVEAWHTIERAFGNVATKDLAPKPFLIGGADSSTGIGLNFVYRPGATGVNAPGGNVYTDYNLLNIALVATKHLGRREVEFDTRFGPPDPFFGGAPSAIVPAGTWNITNVKWYNTGLNPPSFIRFASGCQFVMDPPVGDPADTTLALQIEGYGFICVTDRAAEDPPVFDDISFLIGGNNVRFLVEDGSLPMFRAGEDMLFLLSGDNRLSGLGTNPIFGDPAGASPVVEVPDGATFFSYGGGGGFGNNVFTGEGNVIVVLGSHAFVGDGVREFYNPAFAGFQLIGVVQAPHLRHRIFGSELTAPLISTTPYQAQYNEACLVDTTAGPDDPVVTLPYASVRGEIVIVKDATGNAADENHNITIAAQVGETVEGAPSALIDTAWGAKTLMSDGGGQWLVISDANA